MRTVLRISLLATLIAGVSAPGYADSSPGSRIWATGGVTTIEGSAGGGLVPWATLSGYASDREVGGTLALTRAHLQDYNLTVAGASVNWHNRVEVSFARQIFDLKTIGAALDTNDLTQDIFGLKVRLAGDLLYSPFGQWSAGLQHKRNRTFDLPEAVGAKDDTGTDGYLAFNKLLFAALLDRNVLLGATVRATRANQTGLLGFGGDRNDDYEIQAELAAGVFLNRQWLVGAEYRQKPDNLSALQEEDWWDLFVAWVPDRRLAVTAAWVDLGNVASEAADLDPQRAFYLSLQGSF